ncbi:terminase gpA endonuclease subunit [Vibrio coralliilyticus]|uniref:terminase gpA endonuclease subunit n=1 Tax=Vibrio coralliilyticus TaxID=190893 RepID=UPI00155FC26A|nr:terminase gpA endonuclease subunit [Vibrio coralliilyticus]NRF28254.1 phage terminase large subunit family protein [Vibrio coralliilyticus]NRF51935.1 phage terminase large subunit family protein [Vibrio coralliilyticus]NRG05554.1 phage terminase large subunit family protein [Vibrio coralliilyticus]
MSLNKFDDCLGVKFADAAAIRRKLAYLCRPEDKTPVEAADDDLWISNGSDVTKFLSSQVPYMREPMNCLHRRIYDVVGLMGPARSGKTKALVEGWINYALTQAPGDMLLIYSTKKKAEDISKVDLSRCFSATKNIAKLKTGRKSDDNVSFKHFINGMNLKIDSATETSLSASTYRYVACSDYDRDDDGVGQEGDKFSLMRKRVQNAKSSGMAMAESSPGRLVLQPKTDEQLEQHEAQRCGGIAEIYNQGDRRRFYWWCDDCEHWFMPVFETLHWDGSLENDIDISKTAHVKCPRCTHVIREEQKQDKNLEGRWFREGAIDQYGKEVTDESQIRQSKWATFWFEGVVATYQSWDELVRLYLAAQRQFEETGDENKLMSFYNVDVGRPYILQTESNDIGAHELMEKAVDYPRAVIPKDDRFLIMSIDVLCFVTKRWTIPKQYTKTKKEVVYPLTDEMVVLLRAFKEWQLANYYKGNNVFPLTKRGKQAIHATKACEIVREISKGQWSAHDLRKLARTVWADLGVDYLVAETLLNHAKGKLDQAYIHTHMELQKLSALKTYHSWLKNCWRSCFSADFH